MAGPAANAWVCKAVPGWILQHRHVAFPQEELWRKQTVMASRHVYVKTRFALNHGLALGVQIRSAWVGVAAESTPQTHAGWPTTAGRSPSNHHSQIHSLLFRLSTTSPSPDNCPSPVSTRPSHRQALNQTLDASSGPTSERAEAQPASGLSHPHPCAPCLSRVAVSACVSVLRLLLVGPIYLFALRAAPPPSGLPLHYLLRLASFRAASLHSSVSSLHLPSTNNRCVASACLRLDDDPLVSSHHSRFTFLFGICLRHRVASPC